MKMHQVFYFLALCEEHSFTRAAARCGVAQPSLTRAIQQLELELGGQLFKRYKRGANLTDLGALVRHDLEGIGHAATAVSQKAADFSAGLRSRAQSHNDEHGDRPY